MTDISRFDSASSGAKSMFYSQCPEGRKAALSSHHDEETMRLQAADNNQITSPYFNVVNVCTSHHEEVSVQR